MSGAAEYDSRLDAQRSWALAIKLKRMRGLIEGRFLPSSPAELYVVEGSR